MLAAEGMMDQINPALLRLQSEWWISFLFGPTPQRPHESYEMVLQIRGEYRLRYMHHGWYSIRS